MYYLQAIATTSNGFLKLNLNAKMYNSTLNGKTSAMVKTETQIVDINSVIVQQTTVSYDFKNHKFYA